MALTRCPHCNHLTREDRPACLYCGGDLPASAQPASPEQPQDAPPAPEPPRPQAPVPPPIPSMPPSAPQPPQQQYYQQQYYTPAQPAQPEYGQSQPDERPSTAVVLIGLLAGLIALAAAIALLTS